MPTYKLSNVNVYAFLEIKKKLPLNALLGIDQFIKAKYLLKKINVYNVEMNGVVKPLMLTLHWIFRIDQNLTTLKLKKILSLIVYTSLSERNNMRFSSSILKKLRIN